MGYEQRIITINLGYDQSDRILADMIYNDILKITDVGVVSDVSISDPIITHNHPEGENR